MRGGPRGGQEFPTVAAEYQRGRERRDSTVTKQLCNREFLAKTASV